MGLQYVLFFEGEGVASFMQHKILRFIRVVACLNIVHAHSIVWIYHNPSIHPSAAEELLGYCSLGLLQIELL